MSSPGPRQRVPNDGGGRRCPGCGAVLATDNTARLCGRCHREQRDQLATPPSQLKSDFFETDEFRMAFASHEIGKVFKAYRNHPRHLHIFGKALSQELLARWLGITQGAVSKYENGKPEYNIKTLQTFADILHLPQKRLWFDLPGQTRPDRSAPVVGSEEFSEDSLEHLRVGLTDVLTTVLLRDASVDDMEQRTLQIGKATRFRSPDSLVLELGSDLVEIKQIIGRSPSEILSRRLARVAAQMSGLMSLSLLKIDDRISSRNWVRTARLLAAETDDRNLRSWVQAQEAYYHFYDKNLRGTIESARYSQSLESINPGVGSALAAAVEARAHALMGQKQDALRAIKNAETYLAKLTDDALVPSAFGYNEAQFTFHQENALTRLGLVSQALQVQDRALELCPPEDFLDRALILLDRADCLVSAGEIPSAVELVLNTLQGLEPSQAQGLIANRARETLLTLPEGENHRPGVLELGDAIRSLGQPEEGL
jgi:transcriptional regulator with XRE-family HTH domain/tetratricopeptide (TPR) repeat protein